jgi:hypothetical protein
MKMIEKLRRSGVWSALFLLTVFFVSIFTLVDAKAASIPDKLVNDPVAKALGPEIMNAAIKEGVVVWYGSATGLQNFKEYAEKEFEKRFGIRLEAVPGTMRELTERIRAEHVTGNKTGDVFGGNDNYMLGVCDMGALE